VIAQTERTIYIFGNYHGFGDESRVVSAVALRDELRAQGLLDNEPPKPAEEPINLADELRKMGLM
jgi:hypothetical protein